MGNVNQILEEAVDKNSSNSGDDAVLQMFNLKQGIKQFDLKEKDGEILQF